MTYDLEFHPDALKEWRALDNSVREQLKKKLAERLHHGVLDHRDDDQRQHGGGEQQGQGLVREDRSSRTNSALAC